MNLMHVLQLNRFFRIRWKEQKRSFAHISKQLKRPPRKAHPLQPDNESMFQVEKMAGMCRSHLINTRASHATDFDLWQGAASGEAGLSSSGHHP